MKDVSNDMANAIPTEFDTNMNINSSNINNSNNNMNYNSIVSAFEEALKNMKIEMDDTQMAKFVIDKVTREVYA